MKKIGFLTAWIILLSCGNDKRENNEEQGYTYSTMAGKFPKATVPYQLTDDQLLKSPSSDTLSARYISSLLPDSIKNILKGENIKYVPLAVFATPKEENYYVVKAESKSKKVALLLIFEKENFAIASSFLVPDDDATTTQASSIDKSFSITKSIVRKKGLQILGEGKDVFVYSAETKQFSWVVTDPLDESGELINPIDTLQKKHRFSGDYYKDKKNLISIRDGRYPNQLVVFVHMENGECKGELKGELLLTSTTSAVYRQSGDPCILHFNFKGSTVSIEEEQGCGNYRGIDCPFSGSFTKRKIKPATSQTKNQDQ